jgi:hypothetical protein
MTKTFIEQHPPRVDWDKLRKGPTATDLQVIPPATAEEWDKDGYIVSPLPDDIARKLEARGKKDRASRKNVDSAAE